MTAKSPKIIFFGTEIYSLVALKSLVNGGFNVVAVITKPDMAKGRGHQTAMPPVKTFALEHNIPVWQPNKLSEVIDDIANLQPVTGVLVAYGKIIPQRIIDLFSSGIINLHPSLLPLYRGPSPIESAIVNLDKRTGVSIMQLDAEMDAGPIYEQTVFPLNQTETKHYLYDQLFTIGSQRLVEILPDIISGRLKPTPQNHSQATYCSLLNKDMSLIDPDQLTAQQAEAHVRAYLDFPRSRARTEFGELIVTKAHIAQDAQSKLAIKCKDNKFLVIDELISPASGKKITAQAFLNGVRN